jgi:sensor histidine kinase YesM
VIRDESALKERELYHLVRSYLNLADEAVEEKRGRNIAAYTSLYAEADTLFDYIDREIQEINNERMRARREAYQYFIAESGSVQMWNLLFIAFVSAFSVTLLYMTVSRVTWPLERLAAMAGEISAGNFTIEDLKINSVGEIEKAVAAFNRMKNEIRDFIEELREEEHIKADYMQEKLRNMKMEGLVRRVETYALQAQMNPHFLFNTINTGMQLAIVEGADKTAEYMENMAQLFRHIIRNKEIFVPLRHEIEGLEYYFNILRVRFPRNLDLVLDVDEALLDAYKVPVSILQPLVENCVVHAFTEAPHDGTERRNLINVRAEKIGVFLFLSVRDNGCGIPLETVEKLLHPLSAEDSSVGRVMGLENVIQRLYFFYPDDPDVVRIETWKGEGCAVIIRIDTGRTPCTGS